MMITMMCISSYSSSITLEACSGSFTADLAIYFLVTFY